MEIVFTATLMETALIAFLLAVFFIIRYFMKAKKSTLKSRETEKMAETVISKAIVLSVERTGALINNQPQVKIQLQVTPEKRRNFVTEVKKILSPADVAAIRAGSIIRVKYNPVNTKEISLIDEP
jgi:hypothetical protein